MDLRNSKITLGELFKNAQAKSVIEYYFPILTNPFLVQMALKMSLENTLRLACGPDAGMRITQTVAALQAI